MSGTENSALSGMPAVNHAAALAKAAMRPSLRPPNYAAITTGGT